MKATALIAFSGVFLIAGGAHAATLTVQETLGTFNLVTESYTGNQEVEGRTFIGSDLTNTTGQFGFVDAGDGAGFAALTVDGDLVNSTINLTGSTEADITGTSINSTVNNGTLNEGVTDIPMFDFDSFLAEAVYLESLDGVAADLSDQNNKVFGGAQIIDVDISDLSTGGYSFDFSDSDFLIINVSGTSGSFGMNPLGDTKNNAENVLWNFYEAETIQVNSVISGHVLAPLAFMSGFNGSTEGTVIAESISLTNGELHQQSWTGTVPSVVPTVPLPAGLPLLIGGFGALALLRRRTAA